MKNPSKIVSFILMSLYVVLAAFALISNIKPDFLNEYNKNERHKELSEFVKEAMFLGQQGKYREALQILKDVQAEAPELKEAFSNEGVVHMRMRNYPESIKVFNKALTIPDADSGLIYQNLAAIYSNLKDSINKELYTNLALEHMNVLDKYIFEGDYFLEKKDWNQALRIFKKALNNRSDISTQYIASTPPINLKQVELGTIEEKYSQELLNLMDSKDKGLAINYNKIAYSLARMEKYNEALPYLQKAVKIWPSYKDANENIRFIKNILKKN